METKDTFETGCCPRFRPELWDGKETVFDNKLFLKDHVTSIFHIPVNYGKVMERSMEKIEEAGARGSESLVLTDEKSAWGADVLIAVEKEVPEAEMEKISGTFLSKVFEGSYSEMSKYISEMKEYVRAQGKEVKQLYFYYVYCPKCAKAYGHNYIVLLAGV